MGTGFESARRAASASSPTNALQNTLFEYPARMHAKARAWKILEVAASDDGASRGFDVFILLLITLNVLAVVLETVRPLHQQFAHVFTFFETFSVAVFSVEYVLRLWACTADPRFAPPIQGRLRFAFTPMALVDLLAIVPAFLPFLGFDLRQLRALRLLRLLRVAKLGRYSRSIQLIGKVIVKRRGELVSTIVVMALLLILSSSALYFAEHQAQPETFSSIPAAMWWSIATLTTVGYGDVYPVTALGKCLAALAAIFGIGLFALPTGVLGAAFTDELSRADPEPVRCPHCGAEHRQP